MSSISYTHAQDEGLKFEKEWLKKKLIPKPGALGVMIKDKVYRQKDCEKLLTIKEANSRGLQPKPDAELIYYSRSMLFRLSECEPNAHRMRVKESCKVRKNQLLAKLKDRLAQMTPEQRKLARRQIQQLASLHTPYHEFTTDRSISNELLNHEADIVMSFEYPKTEKSQTYIFKWYYILKRWYMFIPLKGNRQKWLMKYWPDPEMMFSCFKHPPKRFSLKTRNQGNPICQRCVERREVVKPTCFDGIHLNQRRRIQGCPYALEQLMHFQKRGKGDKEKRVK